MLTSLLAALLLALAPLATASSGAKTAVQPPAPPLVCNVEPLCIL